MPILFFAENNATLRKLNQFPFVISATEAMNITYIRYVVIYNSFSCHLTNSNEGRSDAFV